MLKIVFTIISFFCFVAAQSQISALTENGKQVILYENGTWKYLDDSTSGPSGGTDTIKTNTAIYAKNAHQSFLVKSNTVKVGVYINPDKWVFSAHRDNEVNPEYRFSFKAGEASAMLISEKTQIDLINLKQIALLNAQKASVDVRIEDVEYRTVNEKKVLCMEMKGTIKGLKFTYLGYYYSDENGTIQLLTYTTQKAFDGLRKDLEEFLNGFVVIGKK